MSLALQILVTGLASGGVYGLLASGLTLVYRLTGVVHFALGELVGLAVFVTLLVAAGTGPVTQTSVGGGRFALALAAGFLACAAAGAATYAVAVQPYLARGSAIGSVVATLAVGAAVHAALQASFGRPAYVFPDPLPFRRIGHEGIVDVGGAAIQVRAFFVLAVALALALSASWMLTRTRTGRGLRAIAEDVEGARMVGVPVDRLVTLAFALAGAIAMVAAVAAAPSAAFSADSGTLLGIKGLVAAVAVGFHSPLRAFAAGLVLGIAESAIADGTIDGNGLGPRFAVLIPVVLALVAVELTRRRAPEPAE
ncbi:branched-chain amino acid ABC transporter permease [Candidatus Solirubrobacter pratensis]|uniref:branched-chain amino acid ABC transporter permease n=1 Tax=Candidatus Solirubrobacter pratensis TaxID=1298857 RepID=UPI0004109ED3|nr:branched-chain amino acid ABC transporter permease [Candidatus Solirubrobacter pratensis]